MPQFYWHQTLASVQCQSPTRSVFLPAMLCILAPTLLFLATNFLTSSIEPLWLWCPTVLPQKWGRSYRWGPILQGFPKRFLQIRPRSCPGLVPREKALQVRHDEAAHQTETSHWWPNAPLGLGMICTLRLVSRDSQRIRHHREHGKKPLLLEREPYQPC